MLDKLNLRMLVSLQGCLFLIGEDANAQQRPDVKALCNEVASKLDFKIEVQMGAREVLCYAADHCRRTNDRAGLKVINALIRELKDKPRLIVGAMNIGDVHTLGELDDAVAKVRQVALVNLGG